MTDAVADQFNERSGAFIKGRYCSGMVGAGLGAFRSLPVGARSCCHIEDRIQPKQLLPVDRKEKENKAMGEQILQTAVEINKER